MEFGNGLFSQANGGNSMIPTLISIVLMIAIFYFGIIRPNKKKEKEALKMMENLAVGDVIYTYGGIVGKIVQVKADVVVIESTGMKTRLEIMKWAVKNVTKQSGRKADKEDKVEEEYENFYEVHKNIDETFLTQRFRKSRLRRMSNLLPIGLQDFLYRRQSKVRK